MCTHLIVAASFAIALSASHVHAEESATLGGTGETGANERQGAAQAQPGDRRGTTMGRDDEQDRGTRAAEEKAAGEPRGSTPHGDARDRDPATR